MRNFLERDEAEAENKQFCKPMLRKARIEAMKVLQIRLSCQFVRVSNTRGDSPKGVAVTSVAALLGRSIRKAYDDLGCIGHEMLSPTPAMGMKQ